MLIVGMSCFVSFVVDVVSSYIMCNVKESALSIPEICKEISHKNH